MRHPGMINVINNSNDSKFEWSDDNFNKIKKKFCFSYERPNKESQFHSFTNRN